MLFVLIGDKMPEEDADDFIKAADLNGDGKIDYLGILVILIVCLINMKKIYIVSYISRRFYIYELLSLICQIS